MNAFKHEEAWRGEWMIQRLTARKITVCGAGALGSNLVESLCRAGCNAIKVIDKDRVEADNLGTQVWLEEDEGKRKAIALAFRMFRAVKAIVAPVDKELTEDNARKLLKGADLIVDCFDNSASRRLVQVECRRQGIPCLHAGLSAEGSGEVVWDERYKVPAAQPEGTAAPCDIPLARNLIMLTVVAASEEVLDFCLSDEPRRKSWGISLLDMQITEMR